jgi:PAS domain S-box-containing protein
MNKGTNHIFFKLFLFCLFSSVFNQLNAQSYGFQNINQEDGLPSSVINSVVQDSRNLIWIGTDGAGLVKYDGNTFKTYDETSGLKGTFVTDLLEDENSNLIIATKYSGVIVFDGNSFDKKFDTGTKDIKSTSYYKLIKSDAGTYCVGDADIILIKKDYSFERIISFNQKIGVANALAFNHHSDLLITTNKGLYLLDIERKSLTKSIDKLFDGQITLAKNSANEIILSSVNAGLYSMSATYKNLNDATFNKLLDLPKDFQATRLYITKRGSIWVSGDSRQGLLMISGGYTTVFDKANGYTDDGATCFMQDDSRNLYIGTEGSGLFKTGPQSFVDFPNIEYLNSSMIFSLYKDEVNFYVGLNKLGVVRFKEDVNGETILDKVFKNNIGANTIVKNNSGQILIGDKEGLSKIENDKLEKLNLSFLERDKQAVLVVKQDNRSRYFIGTYGSGLIITDSKFEPIAKFSVNNSFADYVYTIDQFETNKWYVGTNNGLYILTEKSDNKFELSERLVESVTFVSTKDVYKNFWFVGSGCIYTYSKNGLKKYDKLNGLTSTLIYTLIADKKGYLWIGSNLGLDKIKVNAKGEIVSVKNFNFKNGFRGLETNVRAQTIDADGNIYLGTAKGVVKCLTNYRIKAQKAPAVFITNIKLSNQNKNWITEKSKNKWVNLPDSGYEFRKTENQLTFQYNVLTTDYTDNFYYSYKLEGSDNEWSNATLLNEVSYSNLQSGSYTFRVKLIDIRGLNLDSEASFKFSIATPFYLTWWFTAIILIFFFSIIYYLFKKFSTFNIDFVTDNSDTKMENKQEARLFLLIFGFFAPFSEIFLEMFSVRLRSELIPSIIVGIACLLLYHFSKKTKFIFNNLTIALKVIFYVYFASSVFKNYFQPFELINFGDYCLIVFFSIAIFKSEKQYWIFVGLALIFSISLFLKQDIPTKVSVAFLNATIFIVAMNYARYISNLNQNEKLLFSNNIVNNGSSLTIASNKFGELSFCSNNVTKILGYTPEEVKGLGFWKLTEDEEFEYADYSEKFVEGKVYVRKLKCKNGTYKYIQWTDTRHSEDLYVGIGQDVTEQIIIQEKYRNMVQTATDMIFETDSSGNFVFVNDVINDSLGYEPEELLGKHFTTLVRKDWKAAVSKFYLKDQPLGSHFDILEFPVKGKGDKEFWVSQKVNVKRDEDAKVIGYSAIVRDITAIKNNELKNTERQEKINKYNATLNLLTTNSNAAALSFNQVLNTIMSKAAEALRIDKISIWENLNDRFECTKEYNSSSNTFRSGAILFQKDFPIYFNALIGGKTIMASNVCENDDTKEFCELVAYPVNSLLDLPIFLNGELSGLICCEMVHSIRAWDEEDLAFARSIADIISISIESRKRQKAEKQLAFRNEISSAVSKITDQLLISENIQQTLNGYLHLIGEATRVDKTYFYENNIKTNIVTLKNEWYKKDTIATRNSENLETLPIAGLGSISDTLLANKPFVAITSKLESETLKQMFEERRILSTLILPIFIKDVFYGFIGFDDCKIERVWDDSHLVILKSFVSNIANAIERINNEKTIKESEGNFRQINETLQDVFLLFDLIERKYIYISPNCEHILGMSQAEFLEGKNFIDTMVLDEHKVLFRMGENDLQTKGFYDIEYRIKTSNGAEKWVREKGNAILDKGGKLIRQSSICSDITEYKKSEIQLKQLSIVAEKTINGVLITDKVGRVVWANQGYLNMFEISEADLIGKRPRDVFDIINSDKITEIDTLDDINYKIELELFTFLKNKIWIEVANTKILDKDGNVIQQIEVVTDISETVKYKNELLRYSTDLEFQSVLQKKIINALSFEELAIETLGFIQSQIKSCIRIALFTIDNRNAILMGHAVINGRLEKMRLVANATSSFSTVNAGNIFINPDLKKSEKLSVSDVEELNDGILSYIVLPILDNHKLIGTLNISLNQTFDLSDSEVKNLEVFTVLLSVAMQQIALKKELVEKNKGTVDSLVYAQNIQNAVLPEIKNMPNTFKELCLYYKPRDIVSGDFYWTKEQGDFTYFALADCTGHGVPGAFLTLIGSRILEQIVDTEKSTNPAKILNKLDEQIYLSLNSKEKDRLSDGMEIALCIINKKHNKLYFAGAGLGLLYYVNDEEHYIKGQRKSIGDYRQNSFEIETFEIDYTGNEVFYMATDGFQDQLGGVNYKRFSNQRLMDLMKNIVPESSERKEQIFEQELQKFKGTSKQTDDITIVCFSLKTNA